MKRLLAAAFAVAAVGLAVAACDERGYGPRGGGYEDPCLQFTSCGACTPVAGCGWCFTPSGKGACVSGPSECATATEFTWTWEPTGCPRVSADASVPVDAAPIPFESGVLGFDANEPGFDGGPDTSTDTGAGGSTDAGGSPEAGGD